MKFAVTRHFGQFQFWHTDCAAGRHEGIMFLPKKIDEDSEEIHCAACGKKAVAQTADLQKGCGTAL